MEPKFKVGDVVVRTEIKSFGGMNIGDKGTVQEANVVRKIIYLHLKEFPTYVFDSESFRLASKADMVKIVVKPKDSVGDVNSTAKGSGARFNAGKPPMDLVPLRVVADYYYRANNTKSKRDAVAVLYQLALWQEEGLTGYLNDALSQFDSTIMKDCANVFDYGRKKYSDWNWAKGMAWSVPLACAARHLISILDDEEIDPESLLPHRGHVACNIVMLLTFQRTYKEGDDRPRCLA